MSLRAAAFLTGIVLASSTGYVMSSPTGNTSNFKTGGGSDIQCTSGAYPPPSNASVPTVIVNLDLPPEQRWKTLIEAKKEQILELRQALVDLVGTVLDGALLKLIDKFGPSLHASLPSPYREELQSLADATGMNLGEVVLYNVFYEFFTVCTSIVAQNEQGQILHARNLDFGLFLGWNSSAHTWSMTQVLRRNVVQLEWQKGGKTVFHSVNFAGYVGLLTAVKPNTLSLTIDERFNVNGGFIGLFQWIAMGERDLQWVGFLARDILESDMNFAQAKQALKQAKLIAPVYFILGGSKPGEGSILTKERNRADADDYTMEANGVKYENWYVLETNYDHWEEPPFYDDRRTTGNFCMGQMGARNVTFENMFNVLSTQPNLNKLTAYTALMNVNTGKIETYLQKCEGDCSPW